MYAEHYANASSSQYGLLNMVLPFVTIVAKLFFCSLADRHRAYRTFFIYALIAALIGYGSFGILPFFIQPQPKNLGLNHITWALICLMTSVSTISMGVISCLSDAFAMNSSKKNNSSYGFIRLWGTLGWGASAFLIAFINQTDSLPILVPGLLLLIALIGFDIIAVILWPDKDDFKLNKSSCAINFEDIVGNSLDNHTPSDMHDQKVDQFAKNVYGSTESTGNFEIRNSHRGQTDQLQGRNISTVKIQWLLFKEIAQRRKSIFRYMILFTISGALISLQWSYFFLYLKNIYEADFTYISGLSMVGQSMLGELPFFVLSKQALDFLGRSHTLSVSIMSLGVRYLLYQFLLPNSSMYFVLLTETLQGPSFGLFYVVMTEVALDYSDCEDAIVKVANQGLIQSNPEQLEKLRQALRATMQSIMSACYEGLGLGVGAIVGGLVIDSYGFSDLWIWSSCLAIALGAINSLIELFDLSFLDKKRLSTLNVTPHTII